MTSGARVAPAAQEQLVALRQPANGQAWGAGDPPRHSAGAAAAASHHCTMSGQLERCEREWHEMEGQFQELQVGPGHLVPQLCYLRRSASPSCSPGPGRRHRQGPGGCLWPDSGGRWPAWASTLPHPSASVLHPLGAPSGSPRSPALALGLCPAHLPRCGKLVCRLRGEVPGVSMWGRPEGTGTRWDSEQPRPHLRRGLLCPHPHPLAFGSSAAPLLW